MNIEWHIDRMDFKPSDSHKEAMANAIEQVLSDELDEPTETTLTDLFCVDQDIEATAGMTGRYYERLRASGVPKRAATAMAAEYNSLLLAREFMDVHDKLGVGMDWEG